MKSHTISNLIMDSIKWSDSPEGIGYWMFYYHTWCDRAPSEGMELATIITQGYCDRFETKTPCVSNRSPRSTNYYRHALNIFIKYEERFGMLPNPELLKSLLSDEKRRTEDV